MKKRFFLFFTFFFLIVMVWVSLPLEISKQVILREASGEENRGILVQVSERERGRTDSYETALLRQLKAKVDAWLKSLNERIEREDITRFEVRFLEILRNILEWVEEKIDAKLEPLEEKKLKKEEEKEGEREDDSWVNPKEFIR
jgi:hypothetical protein